MKNVGASNFYFSVKFYFLLTVIECITRAAPGIGLFYARGIGTSGVNVCVLCGRKQRQVHKNPQSALEAGGAGSRITERRGGKQKHRIAFRPRYLS